MLARWSGGQSDALQGVSGCGGRADGHRSQCGIDAEPHAVLPDGVLAAVSLPLERHEIVTLRPGLHWDRILFCAKEATQGLVSADAALAGIRGRAHHLRRGLDRGIGPIQSTILIDPAGSGPPLTKLTGRWSVSRGLAPDGDRAMSRPLRFSILESSSSTSPAG